MNKRRWLYCGLPIIGCVIGTIYTVKLQKLGKQTEAYNNQEDAFTGAIIWLGISLVCFIVVLIIKAIS